VVSTEPDGSQVTVNGSLVVSHGYSCMDCGPPLVAIPYDPQLPPNPLALTGPGAALDVNVLHPGGLVQVRIAPRNDSPFTVKIFSASGRLARTLGSFVPIGGGQWQVPWDGADEGRRPVPRGVYLIRVSGGGLDEKLKLLVR